MKPLKLILLLTGIFIAGGITGIFGTLRYRRDMALHRPPSPEQWLPNHLKRLAERLELTPEQTELIRPILRTNMDELSHLRTDSMAQTKAIFERMQHDVAEKLTPAQKIKFDQLNKELRDRARKAWPDRNNGPRGGDGPPPGEPPQGKPPQGKPPGGF